MIYRHTTTIDEERPSSYGGVQPLDSDGKGPFIGRDRPTSHVLQIKLHMCTMCGQSCYGCVPTHGTSLMTGGQVRTL